MAKHKRVVRLETGDNLTSRLLGVTVLVMAVGEFVFRIFLRA